MRTGFCVATFGHRRFGVQVMGVKQNLLLSDTAVTYHLYFLAATNRTLYRRVLPHNIQNLRPLRASHPDLFVMLKKGRGYAVRRSVKPWGSVFVDLAHEQVRNYVQRCERS